MEQQESFNFLLELPSLKMSLVCSYTAWKESKYGVFSGPYFPAFELNTEKKGQAKYGPEKNPYLDTFHVVNNLALNNLTDLTRLIRFFVLLSLHTVSKIGMYDLLYILTYTL